MTSTFIDVFILFIVHFLFFIFLGCYYKQKEERKSKSRHIVFFAPCWDYLLITSMPDAGFMDLFDYLCQKNQMLKTRMFP